MAKTIHGVASVSLLAASLLAPAAASGGERGAQGRVVVRIVDHAGVDPVLLGTAQAVASEVYRAIGVTLAWTGELPDVNAGVIHVTVTILSPEMTVQKCQTDRVGDAAFGSAVRAAGRAYVFFGRIARYSDDTGSSAGRVLGVVVAHELGHLLLPENSHSPSGIMRAKWFHPIVQIPGFTRTQAASIRAKLGVDAQLASR